MRFKATLSSRSGLFEQGAEGKTIGTAQVWASIAGFDFLLL